MTAIMARSPKRSKKVKTLKQRIEDILLSEDYTGYADVARQAGGGTVAYVQNVKGKMVAEGRLSAEDRRSKKSVLHVKSATDTSAMELPEATDLSKPERSQARQNIIRAAEMIMEGGHSDMEIMKECNLLIPEYINVKEQVLILQNFAHAVDHYKRLVRERSLELSNALFTELAKRKTPPDAISKMLDTLERIEWLDGHIQTLEDKYNQTEIWLEDNKAEITEIKAQKEKEIAELEQISMQRAAAQQNFAREEKKEAVPNNDGPLPQTRKDERLDRMREQTIQRLLGRNV
jgi:hypothetical protein